MIDEGTFSTIEAILNSISHFKEGMERDMSSRDSHDVISLLDEIVRKKRELAN